MTLLKRLGFLLLVLISCDPNTDIAPEIDKDFAIPDWADASHGNESQPDYEIVFPQTKVNTLEITMTATEWVSIQTDMLELYGFVFGSGGNNQPGQGGSAFPNEEPDYVGVSLKFNNKEWYQVGFRLKGNSTLRNSWRAGIYKLPFRLQFDEFEDDFPQIKNQRFFGFKELSMSPGANDNSLIREKVGSDIFRKAGLPCSQTAFYKVYIDFGEGLKYCGVYTMVEVVDDTMIEHQFGNDDGNIYKPESTFQNFIASQFEKKNNETENDYSDVQATVAALNNPLRISDPQQWRTNLEQYFNADHFIKWLAVNTTMLNWDTYGRMAHNYYLYNHPDKGLTWIPWDNNEALMNRGNTPASLAHTGVGVNWPLIRYIIDDPVYQVRYKEQMRSFKDQVFIPAEMNTLFDTYYNLIAPAVVGPDGLEQGKYTYLSNPMVFSSALEELKQHVINQHQAATEFLK